MHLIRDAFESGLFTNIQTIITKRDSDRKSEKK